MTKFEVRFWLALFLFGTLIGAAGSPVAADTLVTVNFTGQGTGAYAGKTLSGSFQYDQSLRGTSGEFKFQSSGLTHEICYSINGASQICAKQGQCDPFTIFTNQGSNKTFTLNAVDPPASGSTPKTNVVLILPTNTVLSTSTLPLCSTFSMTSPLPSGNSFTLSGGTTFTGTITSISSCTQTGARAAAAPVQAVYVTAAYFPVYACPPRPQCSLSQLFSRCTVRACWW
jgi:hypothetical protein